MNKFEVGIKEAARGIEFMGSRLRVYPRLDSTMRVADALISHACVHGMSVIALEQTAGRGSGNRVWKSGKGNAMFSRIVDVPGGRFGQEIELLAACAVAEVMQELLPTKAVSQKYPNDILIDGKKISGCLVPPKYDHLSQRARKINLGVGVNLRVAPELPDGKISTSLLAEGVELSLANFMAKFENRFEEIYHQYIKAQDFNASLNRMGFLDSENLLHMRSNKTGAVLKGTYAGFQIENKGRDPKASILLGMRGPNFILPVRDFSMTNATRRPSFSRSGVLHVLKHG